MTPVAIPRWMSDMVAVALAMAIICNICVLFRFLERHIWHSTVLSLITATIQGTQMRPSLECFLTVSYYWQLSLDFTQI